MIRYIYGNPGTGKSYTVKSMVVNDALDGRTALMIVPEQSTVSAEREIIQCIPPSAQLNVEVLNFTRLANKLFREHGGLSYNFLNKAHEKLIMWQAIKSALPFLQEYCEEILLSISVWFSPFFSIYYGNSPNINLGSTLDWE